MLFLSAGHSPRSPGAAWRGFQEHAEAALWVQELKRRMPNAYAVPTGELGQKVAFINARCVPRDLAIEVHFNAGNERARGSETLYMPGSVRGESIAAEIQETLARYFTPSRGVKPGYFRTDPTQPPLYFLKATRCAALIIEPEFVYQGDLIRTTRAACCAALATILQRFQ